VEVRERGVGVKTMSVAEFYKTYGRTEGEAIMSGQNPHISASTKWKPANDEGPSYRGIKTDIAETKRTIKWLRERAAKNPDDKSIKAELRQMEATLRHLEGTAKDYESTHETSSHRLVFRGGQFVLYKKDKDGGLTPAGTFKSEAEGLAAMRAKAKDADMTITASRRSQITTLRAELAELEFKLLHQTEDGPATQSLEKEKDMLRRKISRLEKGGRVRGEDAVDQFVVRGEKSNGQQVYSYHNSKADAEKEAKELTRLGHKNVKVSAADKSIKDSSPVFNLTPVPMPSGERNEVWQARPAGDAESGPYDVGYSKGTETRNIIITASSWNEAMQKAKAGVRPGEDLFRVSPRDKNAAWAKDAPIVTWKRAEKKPEPKPWYSNVFKTEQEQREAYRPRTKEEMKHAIRDEELAPVPVDDVEGYTDGSGVFHPISGTKGYRPSKTASGKGHGPKRKKKRARDVGPNSKPKYSVGQKVNILSGAPGGNTSGTIIKIYGHPGFGNDWMYEVEHPKRVYGRNGYELTKEMETNDVRERFLSAGKSRDTAAFDKDSEKERLLSNLRAFIPAMKRAVAKKDKAAIENIYYAAKNAVEDIGECRNNLAASEIASDLFDDIEELMPRTRGRDKASTEQVLKSAGWKRVGGTGDSDDWERGQSGVTTFKTSDEWYFFLGGWDEGGRHGNGASQLASVIGRANDREPTMEEEKAFDMGEADARKNRPRNPNPSWSMVLKTAYSKGYESGQKRPANDALLRVVV
jgi:hypothetical protein